jgi:hypothetical protein
MTRKDESPIKAEPTRRRSVRGLADGDCIRVWMALVAPEVVMRSAGNFHPQWGYLAPAPSFLRGARVVLVATAVGATAGAAVVVSLLERPGADADNSIAAHALVTSTPISAAASPVATSAATTTPASIAAAPASKPVLAQAPADAAAPQAGQSQSASPSPVLANSSDAASAGSAPSTTPAAQSVPLAHAEAAATAESKPAASAKRGRRRRTASNEPVRRWQGENVWKRRRWRDHGFTPFSRLFSSRTGSSDYQN